MAKKRKTFAESAIPEINRPSPNSSPARYAKKVLFASDRCSAFGKMKKFVMVDRTSELAMKIISGDDG
jgi:hypothetical protein